LKIYTFYLPQFHECQYNNEWWGKGFTEWDIVKKGKKQFKGHDQPKIPENGYYDLTKNNTIEEQYHLAKENGIDGFVFYHYWYEGKRPLSKPIDLVLKDKSIDIEFSLCWANHSWTRSWTNRMGSMDVLIEQTYESELDERKKHFAFLNEVFCDERCTKVNNKALFQIYNPENIPNLIEFIKELREYSQQENNIEIHISAIVTAWKQNWDYLDVFDTVTFFQPSLALFSPINLFGGIKGSLSSSNFISAFTRSLPHSIKKQLYRIQDKFFNKIHVFDYDEVWNNLIDQYKCSKQFKKHVIPSAFVDFDNTPRYGKRAKIMKGFSPEKFGKYLHKLIETTEAYGSEKIIFINAWNEWGEGMYLESDGKDGDRRLVEVRNVKNKF
jgi:hypothetical protein